MPCSPVRNTNPLTAPRKVWVGTKALPSHCTGGNAGASRDWRLLVARGGARRYWLSAAHQLYSPGSALPGGTAVSRAGGVAADAGRKDGCTGISAAHRGHGPAIAHVTQTCASHVHNVQHMPCARRSAAQLQHASPLAGAATAQACMGIAGCSLPKELHWLLTGSKSRGPVSTLGQFTGGAGSCTHRASLKVPPSSETGPGWVASPMRRPRIGQPRQGHSIHQ